MTESLEMLQSLVQQSRQQFHENQVILSFSGFLERLKSQPRSMIRNGSEYLKNTFEHFGHKDASRAKQSFRRWTIFDIGTEKNIPIVGCEPIHEEIYKILRSFVRQGLSNKLILLHGPNGSAKTSIIEALGNAMQKYSRTDEGAVYRFSWIFPTDKTSVPQAHGESGPIGFGGTSRRNEPIFEGSYAFLDEKKIASKIHSEYKENPIYLIPMPEREIWLRNWIAAAEGIAPEEVELPPHVLLSGLSKRNQLIFDQLLASCDGDLAMVYRHIQIERFYFSKQYRMGIGTVEPQLSIDAYERQLTMDRNIANLPPILHNISFHEAAGPLVEANRGILEFSDFLKRPLEAFKYLLSTVEKGTLNLPSATAQLDIVFFATTNAKHLDAFKTVPDFASFRSRIELITAPYLLELDEEQKIYKNDVKAIAKSKTICPHTLELVSLWAVMTRLKQPDPGLYESKARPLIARLDPLAKAMLYTGSNLGDKFKPQDQSVIMDLRRNILEEYQGTIAYEGRFGASPREIKGILYRASENPKHPTVTPMAIFEELERLVKDRTTYEFLQLEPKGDYHRPDEFIKTTKGYFVEVFEREVTMSMTLVEEAEYELLLTRYIDHVVALVKKERIFNKATNSHEAPSEKLMKEVEQILKVSGPVEKHRESLLGRIAAYRLDNPSEAIVVTKVFHDFLKAIQNHYYRERQKKVDVIFKAMLTLDTPDAKSLDPEESALAQTTFQQLEAKYGYDIVSARSCLKFLMTFKSLTGKPNT
ncbi:MAG: hypothetical protein AB7T49_05390 [Oligoflexales bacterium]